MKVGWPNPTSQSYIKVAYIGNFSKNMCILGRHKSEKVYFGEKNSYFAS